MAPDTRPPLSHLRPTLSTRLRRSFDGKRSKTSEAETTNGSINGSLALAIDPEVLRNAVEQAILGEAFQRAIAANLANLVKPAIKSALDTIQPVVEAVYSHDLLLRKTDRSVDRLLENMDTIQEEDEGRPQHERSASAGSFYDMEFKALLEKSNKRTIATLAELSNALNSNTTKITSLESSFASMKENNAALFSTHGNKLDLMALYITEIKDQSELIEKLESVSIEINGLRASVDPGFMEIGAKLDTVVSIAEIQAGALDAIKHSTAKTEILAAIQKSHDYHDGRSRARSIDNASARTTTADNSSTLQEIKTYLESHSTVLGEIKEKSLVAPVEVTGNDATSAALQEIKTHLKSHSTVLNELKERPKSTPVDPSTANTEATLQDIKTHLDSQTSTLEELKGRPHFDAETSNLVITSALQELKTHHESHAVVLEELKGRASFVPVDNTDAAATLQELKTYLESHSTTLEELKGRPLYVSGTDGADNTAILQDIKSHLDTHSTSLGEIKERSIVPPKSDDSEANVHLNEIKSYLESHSTALNELKERPLALPQLDMTDVTTSLDSMKTQLESHSSLLAEIKEVSSLPASSDTTAEISAALAALKEQLESLKEIIETGHGSNSELVGGLGSKIDSILVTIDGHRSTDSSSEILAALQKSNDSHDSHATALDGIKSLVVVPPPVSTPVDLSGVEAQLTTIVTTLEGHTNTISELSTREPAPVAEVSPPASDETLNLEIKSILTTLDTHTKLINEIKENVSAEILTALHDMGQTQSLHTATLAELRDADMSDEILTALHTSNEAHSGHQAEFEKLHGAVRGFDEKYEMHGVDLGEIKSRSLDVPATTPEGSGIADLETKIGGIVSILEEQNTTLSSIKSSTDSAVESHSAHAVAFGQLHSRSLEIPSPPVVEKLDTSDLENKIAGIVSVLDEQNTTLSSIKEGTQSALDAYSAHTLVLGEIHSRVLEPPAAPVVEGVSNAELEAKIASIVTILDEQNTALSAIKEQTQSAVDSHSAQTLKLGEIHSRALELPDAPVVDEVSNTDLEAKIAGIMATLEAQNAELSSIKQSTESAFESHSVSLGEIKSRSLELASAPEGPSNSDLELKIIAMTEALDHQKSALENIHTSTTAALESHASHAVSLGEIKSRSLEPASDEHALALEAKINGIVEVLEQQKSKLSDIHTSTNSALESHATHALSLDKIKARSLEPVAMAPEPPILQELESKIANIITILEEQTIVLATIKDSTNAGIDSHTSVLDEIKASTLAQRDLHDSHTTALSEIKDATLASKDLHIAHSATLADLVIATSDANDSHASKSSTLAELKAVPPPVTDLSGLTLLETDLKNILETLSLHTTALSGIDVSSSTGKSELLASIKESHDILSTHTVLLDSIKSSSSTSHEELITNLSGLKSTLDDTKSEIASHTTALSEIGTLTSTANPDLVTSIKDSHDILSNHTVLLDSINSSSSNSHEEVLTNLKSVHSTLEDTKSDISTHGSLVKDLHAETKNSHSSITAAISALAIGGAAGAGLGFLASRANDDDQVESLPEPVVERSITPPLVEEHEIESVSAQVDEPVLENSISSAAEIEQEQLTEVENESLPAHIKEGISSRPSSPLPDDGLAPQDSDQVIIERDTMPPLDANIEPESSSLPGSTAEVEQEIPIPQEIEEPTIERTMRPTLEADHAIESTSLPIEDSILEDALLSLPLQNQTDSEPLSTSQEIIPSEELPHSALDAAQDSQIASSTDETPESVDRDLTPDLENNVEALPSLENTETQPIETIVNESVTEDLDLPQVAEPLIEQSLSPDTMEQSESFRDATETDLLDLPVSEVEQPAIKAIPHETEPIFVEITDGDIQIERSISPLQDDAEIETVLPSIETEAIYDPSISAGLEESIQHDTNKIQDGSVDRSIINIDHSPDLAGSQSDGESSMEMSSTPIQDETTEIVSPINVLDVDRSITPTQDHDLSIEVDKSEEPPIDRSVALTEEDDLQSPEAADELMANIIRSTIQDGPDSLSLPIADELTSDEHPPQLSLLEPIVIENHEDERIEQTSESNTEPISTPHDEASDVKVLLAIEDSGTQNDISLDQSQIAPSVIESQTQEISSLPEEYSDIQAAKPIETEGIDDSLPISSEAGPSQDQISLDLSAEPAFDAETIEHEEIVARDATIHHHITTLPPIVVEDHNDQVTILEPEHTNISDPDVLDSNSGPSEIRGLSPEPSNDVQENETLSINENVNSLDQDVDSLTEQNDSESHLQPNTTHATSTVTEIFEDDEVSSQSDSDQPVVHALSFEVDSSPSQQPFETPSDIEQRSSIDDIEINTMHEANVQDLTTHTTESSDSIDLAENVDRVVPDLDGGHKSEKPFSDAGSETTAIQDPIALVEQIDQNIPDILDGTNDEEDISSRSSSPRSLVTQIAAQAIVTNETSLQEDPLSLRDEEKELTNNKLNIEDESSSLEAEIQPTSSAALHTESAPMDIDRTGLSEDLAETPGIEHDILDAYLTPEPTNAVFQPTTIDDSGLVIDSEHAVTRTNDQNDDVMSVMSSDEVVSPSEWMFRSSGPKTRNFALSEEDDRALDIEESSGSTAEMVQPNEPDVPLVSIEEPNENITPDYFPAVTQPLQSEDRSRSPSISRDDETSFGSTNAPSNLNDDIENESNGKDSTPAPENTFAFDFNNGAELSNNAPSPATGSSPLINEPARDVARELDQSPLASPAYTESIYSVMNESVGTPHEQATRNFDSSFGSPADERNLEFGSDGHHASSDIRPAFQIIENVPLHSQVRLEDLSPLGDEAFDFDDHSALPHHSTTNVPADIPSSPPVAPSFPTQTPRLEDLSPLGDDEFDFSQERSIDLPAHLDNEAHTSQRIPDLDSLPLASPLHADSSNFEGAKPLDTPTREAEPDASEIEARDEDFSPILSTVRGETFHDDEDSLSLTPRNIDNSISQEQTKREVSSSPVLTPAEVHFGDNKLNEQEPFTALGTSQYELDERYKRPSSADPYDDEDMVVEWSGKDHASTSDAPVSSQKPEEATEKSLLTPKETFPVQEASEEVLSSPTLPDAEDLASNSPPNEPSSPVLESQLPKSSDAASEKPNVFQYMDHESDAEEAFSPVAISKGREVGASSSAPPPPAQRRSTEEELAAWMPVDLDKRYSQVPEPVPDYFASPKSPREEELMSPGLPDQTDSEPITPATPAFDEEPLSPASVAKKAAGGKKKKGKKGKK